ncbi:hypothetical protein [uncultured Draconibacterium sp.]|uniref:hypothetical protein n=1 Tax=uncultured Draconibacterium sp. TaxID=1573823 RepID=UPI0029C9887F|nr:hypothetical protein [uncultured Draconibacterium sp.]
MLKKYRIKQTDFASIWYVDLCAKKVTWTKEPASLSDNSEKKQTQSFFALQNNFNKKNWEILYSYFLNFREEHQSADLELKVVSKNGTKGRIRFSSNAIFEAGQVVAIISIVKEIPLKPKLMPGLNHQDPLKPEIETLSETGGWEFNILTRRLTWTKEVYKIYELDEKFDLNIKKAISFYPPASKKRLKTAVRNAIESGKQYNLKLTLLTAQLNLIEVRTIGKVVYNSDGDPIRLFGSINKINGKSETNREL